MATIDQVNFPAFNFKNAFTIAQSAVVRSSFQD